MRPRPACVNSCSNWFSQGACGWKGILESTPEHRHGLERRTGQSAHDVAPAMQPPVRALSTRCRNYNLPCAPSGMCEWCAYERNPALWCCAGQLRSSLYGATQRASSCAKLCLVQVCEPTASFRESCVKHFHARSSSRIDHRGILACSVAPHLSVSGVIAQRSAQNVSWHMPVEADRSAAVSVSE